MPGPGIDGLAIEEVRIRIMFCRAAGYEGGVWIHELLTGVLTTADRFVRCA